MPRFNLEEYVDVQTRISEFYKDHPNGAIRTSLESSRDDFEKCRYRAEGYKDRNSEKPDATGYAFELAGGTGPNATSHEENAETSAIGRMLANMGYATTSKDRPSRQEMEKVNRGTAAQSAPSKATPAQQNEMHGFEPGEYYSCEVDGCENDQEGSWAAKCYDKYHQVYCGKHWSMAKRGELGNPKEDIEPQSIMEAYGGER